MSAGTNAAATGRALSRAAGDGHEPAPVRIVHLGLGNFFRAHQAWYTEHAPDARQWGIAAFTGRNPALAAALGAQDNLYTHVTRGAGGDQCAVVASLSATHAAGDHAAWLDYWRSPGLAVVTSTVTEAGYVRAADGHLDATDPGIRADVTALRGDLAAPVRSAPAKFLAGLAARHTAGRPPVAIMPCDNLPDNGAVVSEVIQELAGLVDPALAAVVDGGACFVTTVVDRITPHTTDEDRASVRQATGRADAEPVVTEPFSEWVISGEFPAGRPAWDAAGAQIVPDVAPFGRRKLWLLNGAHSLLAYAGSIRGHETVAAAIADPFCGDWAQEWWDEASPYLTLPAHRVAAYREALLERFANPRIRHLLAQVAVDGSQKLPVRVLPVMRLEAAQGRVPSGAARIVAAWICHLRGLGAPVEDSRADVLAGLVAGTLEESVARVLGWLDADLASDERVRQVVLDLARELPGPA